MTNHTGREAMTDLELLVTFEQRRKGAPLDPTERLELQYWRDQYAHILDLRSAVDGKSHRDRIAALSRPNAPVLQGESHD